ncbi:MAG: crossover junction endodeoxyribonuclease RuvC [Bacteroidota bacterium]
MVKPRIILGIDPGTQISGYGLIQCEGKRMRLVHYGLIRLSKGNTPHPERLKKIFERINGLIQEFKPGEMALEAPFYGRNIQAMLKLGRAQGVAMAAGLVNDLPIYEYAPRKVKMAVTGNGNASKEQVAGMLEKLLNFEHDDKLLDATDALGVAVCHYFQGDLSSDKKSYKNWADYAKQKGL